MKEYRRKWIRVSDQLLLGLLQLPQDASLITVRRNFDAGGVELLVESEEYSSLPEGGLASREDAKSDTEDSKE